MLVVGSSWPHVKHLADYKSLHVLFVVLDCLALILITHVFYQINDDYICTNLFMIHLDSQDDCDDSIQIDSYFLGAQKRLDS